MRVLQDQGHATIEDAEEALLELETKAEKAKKAADAVAKKFLMEWGDDIADFQAGA